MFEIFHASTMIGKWLEQLPAEIRAWLSGSYWYFMAACLVLIVWRLSHSKDTLAHGEVKLTWYKPSQWLRRWLSLREQGYANAPSWFPKYMRAVQLAHDGLGALLLAMLGLMCLGVAYALDDASRLLWLLGGGLALWWAWTLIRRSE
jgi:hypothetical protein